MTENRVTRSIGFPSIDFPAAPRVTMLLPEPWRPVSPLVLNEMFPRPDIAVAGPTLTAGVRPNLMVKVSRAAVDVDPAGVLTELFRRQGADAGAVEFRSRLHLDADQPYGVSRYRERIDQPPAEVLRLTLVVMAWSGTAPHLVLVQAALAADSPTDLADVEAIFGSLRVGEQPGVTVDG